jgi:putative ABC transport system permease protein
LGPAVDLDVNVASREYFTAVAAPIVAGSGFDADAGDGCGTAIVNREAESEYFAGAAVGGALIAPDGSRAEIVGVADAGPLRVMQRRTDPMVYLPWGQYYAPRMTLIAVTPWATPERLADITSRVNGISGAKAPPDVSTLEAQLSRTALGPERIGAALIASSAVVALALGLLGVSGVMSDTVLQRRRDIALRLALGARAAGIVGTVLRHGLRIAAAGAAAGLTVAWVLVRVVMHSHPDVHAPALWMWLACPAVLLSVVLIATIAPARWALAVDPMTITREG